MTGLALIAAIVLIYWLVPKVVYAAAAELHKKARPNELARGMSLVKEEIHFHVQARPADVVRKVAKDSNLPRRSPRGLKFELWISHLGEQGIEFTCSSIAATSFKAVLGVTQTDTGTEGVYAAQEWTLEAGIVCHREQLERLSRSIQRSLDEMRARVSVNS